MEPTNVRLNPNQPVAPPRQSSRFTWSEFLDFCLGLLPYLMYVSLLGMVSFLGAIFYRYPKRIAQQLYRHGFWAITLLLGISTLQAHDRGEASLQLAHFLPYFLLWAALMVYLPSLERVWTPLTRWAWILVIGTFPLSLIALAEYGLKRVPSQPLPWLLAQFPPLDWLYTGDALDPRAYSLFNSPNTFANYGVMVMGLIVGLLVSAEGNFDGAIGPNHAQRLRFKQRGWLSLTLGLLLIGLYCSGSRNGYLVAFILLAVGLYTLRRNPWMRWLGLGGVGAIVVSVLSLGIGGRSLSWAWVTEDPRVYVWQLALRLIVQRPWWGHGLGHYKFLYDGSVPGYDGIPHAHNLWLSLAAEAGLFLTIVLTLVIGMICYRGAREIAALPSTSQLKGVALGYGYCFLAMALFSFFDVTLYDARLNLLSWLSLAVLGSLPELAHRGDP
ncbi:O-antigen ligase family protein [Leptolyngbya sp. PCC 6406]|uniref:O-antigen ligase family protein n=1 Tax=Leptolyngbya sp. PCC 6406 TaxID=1173264 RepID=UPI0002AD1848|nr:O-antigen ligase family protein [Leptolyngbya sp. PCC 6406]